MDERAAVAAVQHPVTVGSLVRDLDALGLAAGDIVLLHSSLSSLGWVSGGGVAVVTALLEVLGPGGTLVVPTHSGDLSDPAHWGNPPVPEAWWDVIRATMPAYHPDITPSRAMGSIPEIVRRWPDASRSAHPQVSFAAVGPAAKSLLAGHALAYSLGERSPLARLYDADALVLLLGVGHDRNTSLHLAEYRSAARQPVQEAAPVLVQGRREWATFADIDLDPSDFPAIGAELEAVGAVRLGPVGAATARLMRQRQAVDHATRWLQERATSGSGGGL